MNWWNGIFRGGMNKYRAVTASRLFLHASHLTRCLFIFDSLFIHFSLDKEYELLYYVRNAIKG